MRINREEVISTLRMNPRTAAVAGLVVGALLLGAGGCKDKYSSVPTPASPPSNVKAEMQKGEAARRPGSMGGQAGTATPQPGGPPGPAGAAPSGAAPGTR